jgi:hypothetical protein
MNSFATILDLHPYAKEIEMSVIKTSCTRKMNELEPVLLPALR